MHNSSKACTFKYNNFITQIIIEYPMLALPAEETREGCEQEEMAVFSAY